MTRRTTAGGAGAATAKMTAGARATAGTGATAGASTSFTSSTTGGGTAGGVATDSGPRGTSPGGEPFGHGATKYRRGCLFITMTLPRYKPKQ